MRARDLERPEIAARRLGDEGPEPVMPAAEGGAPAMPEAGPPDPHKPWIAEVAWDTAEPRPRFTVNAWREPGGDRIEVIRSEPVEWPPSGPEAVQALNAAVGALERDMLGAGWTALGPGAAWYAKRFAWVPAVTPGTHTPAPATSGARRPRFDRTAAGAVPASEEPAAEASGDGRFGRGEAWPEGSEELWRCELVWERGYRSSRFVAMGLQPEGRGQHAIGASRPFKWMLRPEPEMSDAAHWAGVRALLLSLEAAGWERVGRGAKWWNHRFVWRRTGTPHLVHGSAVDAPP